MVPDGAASHDGVPRAEPVDLWRWGETPPYGLMHPLPETERVFSFGRRNVRWGGAGIFWAVRSAALTYMKNLGFEACRTYAETMRKPCA